MAKESPNFDCVICVAGKDSIIVQTTIKLLFENIHPEHIFIITKPQYFFYYRKFKKLPLVLIDEDGLVKSLTYESLNRIIAQRDGVPLRTGWYFQQFLKIGFALTDHAKEYYLIWDADTLPLSKISFFDNGSPLFTMKTEYHSAYFGTMDKLLNLNKCVPYSFIAENMMIRTCLMKDLIEKISSSTVPGENWYSKIINAIPQDHDIAFSEFETYGTFVTSFYPNLYKTRELRTFRDAGYIYGRVISNSALDSLSRQYDTITLEPGHKPTYPKRLFQLPHRALLYYCNRILDWLYAR